MGAPDDPDDEAVASPRRSTADVTVADAPKPRAHSPNLEPLLARFTIRGTLGEGGMGTVVEAVDNVLGRAVAIKVLMRDPAADPSLGERFLREARAAARLRHPGIVQVHDIDPGGNFIVMELVRGESLSVRLHDHGKLSVSEVRRIGSALLEALGVAHAAGIVHRDVKPANVLLGDDGEVKLADFGVAFFGDSDLTVPGTRVGTPAYMAPEQLRAREVDARADVYSAGATLFEAATGKRLHQDDAQVDVEAAVLAATGDRVLAAAIARAVRERPGERHADGRAFAAALAVTEVAPPAAKRKRSRRPIVIGAAALAVAATIATTVMIQRRRAAVPAPPPASAHHTVALLPFADATHNALLDFAEAGLPNLLGLELHDVPGLTVLGYYRLLSNVSTSAPDEWTEAAKKLGADVIVRGELARKGDVVRVMIYVDSATGGRLDTITREARVEDVPELVRGAAPYVVHAILGRTVETAAHAPTTFTAERELQLGIADLEREKLDEALGHLRAAVDHAPTLPLAHFYLAVTLYWAAPPTEPARAEIERALELVTDDAHRGFLGALRRLVDQDYAGGLAQLRPLSEKYPDDKDILYLLFETLYHGGHPAEAMGVYRRVVALAPRFRLALVHAFTFYASHGDDAGMSWALALGDPAGDTYSRIWEPRVLVARREYEPAIRLLSRSIDESTRGVVDLQAELISAYALSEHLDLGLALGRQMADALPSAAGPILLGLALARGDEADRKHWLDVTMRASTTAATSPNRNAQLQMLAAIALLSSSEQELADLSRAMESSLVADFGRSINLNLVQALLAEQLGDTARVDAFAASPYPEVAAIAASAASRRKGDHRAAADAMRRAIAAASDARYIVDEWALLAADLHAAHDPAGVIAACDEVIRPRLFNWAWGSTAAACLAWTGEANETLGHVEAARAAWRKLIAQRTGAAPDDALITAAKAALARLGR